MEGGEEQSGEGSNNKDDDDKDEDDNDEPDVSAVTSKPYLPGPLSEELGNEAVEVYQECMDELEAIALSANKPLQSILSHVNAVKPPGVHPPNPWNAFASWYNVEGKYEKPKNWTIQQWNAFMAKKYHEEVVEAIGEEGAKDPNAVREAMEVYLDWYKQCLNKHLDKVKSNPKKLSRYLNKMIKLALHYTKQLWMDHDILVWGAAHPTKHNNTSVGQGVMWSGSPLFARVKERSETQVL
ncbi:hypothetical protein V5O48_019123 [Marasmius crinis-equi]|uniref:Uncharacterized protein n=1 Tax=Marasmius crinis-equi TaxID=585013 RepID=A0ABR3EJ93_9AGAR